MFHNCFSLKKLPDISKWKTSNILNMKGLFEGCKSLISMPDISVWDTRNVKDMSYMFNCCFNLKLLPDISKWKTQNLNNLSHMFSNCPELTSIPDLSKWNINKVEDISGMFENCSSLINLDFLSKWKSTNIKNMDNLFNGCSKLKIPHLINWNIKEGTKTLNSNKKPTMNINKKNNNMITNLLPDKIGKNIQNNNKKKLLEHKEFVSDLTNLDLTIFSYSNLPKNNLINKSFDIIKANIKNRERSREKSLLKENRENYIKIEKYRKTELKIPKKYRVISFGKIIIR